MKLKHVAITLLACTSMQAQEITTKTIEFRVTHPTKSVSGKCGSVEFENFKLQKSSDGFSAPAFSIRIDVDAMTTGNQNRDSNMMEVLGFPASGVIHAEIDPISARVGSNHLTGTLKINGKEKRFESDFNLSESGSELVVIGDVKIHFSDFDLPPPRLFLMAMKDDILIHYRFTAN